LDEFLQERIDEAIEELSENGPAFGRPFVDTVHQTSIRIPKEYGPWSYRQMMDIE
jgi:hypothetical protein